MYATYRREYANFTHLAGESIDALFQRFTVVVNNMRANVDVLPCDDHDRAIKLLHSLNRMVWGGKFEAIMDVGGSHKGPLNNQGETCLKPAKNAKQKSTRTPKAHAQHNHDPGGPPRPARTTQRTPLE
jgi:hypothetical protein